MVEDLLRGFAARDWIGDLDFASLTPLPASYVSHDLRQRHGDLVRFRDDRWLYVVLLLEFQSAVDRSMAVRMLTYTGLLYQRHAFSREDEEGPANEVDSVPAPAGREWAVGEPERIRLALVGTLTRLNRERERRS